MDKRILFETSPWFILVCLLTGLVYAFLLYSRKNPWEKKYSWWLGAGRFIIVSVITFLLLGPLIRQIRNNIIPPAIVLAIDNSQSIPLSYSDEELTELKSRLDEFAANIDDRDLYMEIRDLEGDPVEEISGISFENAVTNIEGSLRQIESDFENRNLSGVILVTDGIYNQGISPIFTNFSFPVYSLGVGDTIEKKDLAINSLLYNKIVYQGNKFPLICELTNIGFEGSDVRVDVMKNNEVIQTQNVSLMREKGIQDVKFELDAGESGLQRYQVRIRPVENEFSLANNTRDAYVEIVEGKEKILLLAPAPHPDIKVIRNAIEKNENYEVHLVIPGIYEYNRDKYDVAILHQLPDGRGTLKNVIDEIISESTPIFYILGSQSNLFVFNEMNYSITIRPVRNQFDNVFASLNPAFSLFNIEESTSGIISDLPPITVPFGEYTLKGEIETLLFQRVGKIVTGKPLFLINKNTTQKEAVLTGAGLWQWRLSEFNQEGNFDGFDDLIGKVIQYLSAKEDKRKFKVYPINTEIPENEPVLFETETYNDIYEKIFGNKVELIISDENDSTFEYSYVTSPVNSTFRIGGLNSGVFRYTARTNINGEVRTANGMFTVKKMQLESISLTANHQLLKELSRRTGGNYYTIEQIDQLQNDLETGDQKSMIVSSENYMAIINMKWLFFVILLLITLEWGFRKYLGGY